MTHILTAQHRRLSWSEWGNPQGQPVIFCTGAGMAGALPFGDETAQALGLRIISVDRPGLGGSDHDPAKSFDSWCADIRALLAYIGVKKAHSIGFSQGAPFALALGAAGLAHTVSLVSGQDELSDAAIFGLLPEPVAAMVQRAKTEPEILETEIAAGATAEWLWQMIEMMSGEQDRAYYASSDFAPAYKKALAAGFRQGAAGYARDTILALAPWPFKAEAVSCPVYLWYGLEDTSPVHSPDFGAILQKRFPSAERTCFAGEGSAILWTKAGEILKKIAATTV